MTKVVYAVNTGPTRGHGAMQPISTEWKEIRTVNEKISEQPVERKKKFGMAGGLVYNDGA